ncbi:MAG: glycosyl hydrolase [Acidobacteriota bacterium]|nr:glycosyl hydrolase [Blastocatellia bacterium]MDW8413067.1 glycosyl hydrolase [Acidobacteriota bacterium]
MKGYILTLLLCTIPPTSDDDLFSGLKLRSLGPALTSGRISSLAVNPKNRAHYYVGVASGGVWVTKNAGITFEPIFDKEGSYSIGAVAIDPKNPFTVWVGTGENNSQRSVSYGDGVYKSTDGGKSWKNVGLKRSEHIGRIVIDPRNSQVVFVAAQGPLWAPGGDRGLYKTTDGGDTWKQVINISENTGVSDVVIDPKNPDVMYASTYQRRRHVWTLINGGPECGIYKSTDGGETWQQMKAGLPVGEMGRIGLTVSPADTRVVYAIIEAVADKGGVFRSTDYGATWEKRNPFNATAMYYSQIVADPKDVDRVYILNTYNMVSDDGGKTVRRLGEKNKHVDNHALWIDPNNPDYLLAGCDGGIYESYDRGENWRFMTNLPVTQFYRVAVDNELPFYNVYGGTQDNFTLYGPSRTRTANGITNYDWRVVVGGDGFHVKIDPEDPDTVYGEYQYGGLVRFNKKTGQRVGIKPQEGKGEPPLRWNWDSPLLISPHSHTRLYFAANKLFRSDDRGNSWRAISGDLTRQLDRDKLPVMGKIWGPDAVAKHASTSFYGNITALTESPKKEGLIYVGTDDGLIQVTEDGGNNWHRIDKVGNVPEMTYVTCVLASQHDVNTVYATFSNHKNGDFKPYVLRSTDRGRSWKSLSSNLPENSPVWTIAEDYLSAELLFLGTEYGLYFSTDGGDKWIRLKGGLPTIAVRDIAIQKRENDLVIATFGRGLYILDDYSPLRLVGNKALEEPAKLFPVKDAIMYVITEPFGEPGRGFHGESFFIAENPPYGAVFTYYLKESLKTLKEKRQEREKEAEKSGRAINYPSRSELREEALEPSPEIILTISDSDGHVLRRLNGPTTAGIHRVAWNLRSSDLSPAKLKQEPRDELVPDLSGGFLVLPGTYKVTLQQRINGATKHLAGPVEFKVVTEGSNRMPSEDFAELYAFQQKLSRLYRAVRGAQEATEQARERLRFIQVALKDTQADTSAFVDKAHELDKILQAIQMKLNGDVVMRARQENDAPSIYDRIMQIIEEERMSTAKPTQTHIESYKIASEEFSVELEKLRSVIENELKALEQAIERAGAPYTPGRIPVWKEE